MYTLGIATDGYLHLGPRKTLAITVSGYLDEVPGTMILKLQEPELKGIPKQPRKKKMGINKEFEDEDNQLLAILHSFINVTTKYN